MPLLHSSQFSFAASVKVPASHVVHDEAPDELTEPDDHALQLLAPLLEKVPADQLVHEDELAAEYVPASQFVHELAPSVE